MTRERGVLKLMRSDLTNRWYAVKEKGGKVTDRWVLDTDSTTQLEAMRDAHERQQ